MNTISFGAVRCALFCGWLVVAGCGQLSVPLLSDQRPTVVTLSSTVTSQQPTGTSTPVPAQIRPTGKAVVPTLAKVTETSTPEATLPVQPATPTPLAESNRSGESAPAPVGTVVFYEERVTLPTYPYERYQSDAVDPLYNWPYKRFDVERFRVEAPKPEPRTYRLLVLENAYLKVMILPELGGRIWQVIHKPSGAPMFYQNDVVKPTHWGIENQKGWLALGGLEWSLPVAEHGYDWGSKWGYIPLPHSEELASVTVFTPRDGRLLNASINISLRAGAASFEIEPTLTNLTDKKIAFSFWHDAMLAPGSGKRPSAKLHFVIPGATMTLHSTNDAAMPLPGQSFTWPTYAGRDFSRLGNFRQYLGFFEAPAAHGPFVGLYDPTYDAGAVRIFPADKVRGSKVFTLGWQDALTSDNFADDDSMYVELHGGLAPTFSDQTQLPAKGQISWRELWYPVTGIGDLSFANEIGALAVQPQGQQWRIALYPTRPLDGTLVRFVDGVERERISIQARPDAPYQGLLSRDKKADSVTVLQLQDSAGRPLLTYQLRND